MLTNENIMTKKEQIEKQVDEAMGSFDGAERATPRPYLLTRIHAGMSRATTDSLWEKAVRFIAKPAVAFSVICLVLLINVTAVLKKQATPAFTAEQVAAGPADEFSYTASTIYDLENTQPNDK